MIPAPIRVIKVGGSLLDFELLPIRLCDWLSRQAPLHNVLIAGGGAMADAIRAADKRFQLGEEASHSLCIDVLGVTARLLHAILAQRWDVIASVEDLHGLRNSYLPGTEGAPTTRILDAGSFMKYQEANSAEQPLPHRWDVTSDSIAAHVAVMLEAKELVLLKSATPTGLTRQLAADKGFTDSYFPNASRRLQLVRAVNLRSDSYEESMLLPAQ